METSEKITVNSVISQSLKQAITYQNYRDLVDDLAKNNSTTGPKKTEALANYTALNQRRMKRWDKTVKLTETQKNIIKNYTKKVTWLVITESWCGDAAHVMPVINKVAQLNANISYKVVLRDENKLLIQQFLTNGGEAIPKLIVINEEENTVENNFGPRPSVATKLVADYKAKHGHLTPEFKEDLQRWYNKDKGQSTVEDVLQLLA